ncbi:hypothetical protein A5886_001675 [Enterococcus sp. 8G7_MSG3316]|uniref:Mga helix-turn-helix domain-containing protein n=2 Tax=Candidatus Enterococcus testudinis TaxID=1834191 RepID=A0A242A6D5_9ENTE|nr:hypothetical protein A5886_001675 [Enterococcus sp. 8G7_MSG3316]
MNLMQLLEKNQQVHFQILAIFFQEGSEISYKKLAKKLSVSAPTLQKEMQNLDQSLRTFHEDATISFGENDRVHLTLPVDFDLREFLYQYLLEAVDFQILSYVFFHREESTTKMMLDLMLSEASLFRHFKAINALLAEFDIQLKNKKLVGDERQIRFFFFQFFSQSYPEAKLKSHFARSSTDNLIKVIERQLAVDLSKGQESKLSLWLGLMEARFDYRGSQQHEFSYDLLKSLENDADFQVLRNVMGRYLSRFAVSWSDYETVYLYLFLLAEGIIVPTVADKTSGHYFWSRIQQSNTVMLQALYGMTAANDQQDALQGILSSISVQSMFIHGAIIAFAELQPETVSNSHDLTVSQKAIASLAQQSTHAYSIEKTRHLVNELLLVQDWLQVTQEQKFVVGILLSQSHLRSAFLRRFLMKELAGYPNIHFEKAPSSVYDLLIVDHPSLSEGYRYKRQMILTGGVNPFEEERLHSIVEEIRRNNLESELERV